MAWGTGTNLEELLGSLNGLGQGPRLGAGALDRPDTKVEDPLATLLQGSLAYQRQHGLDPMQDAADQNRTSPVVAADLPPTQQVFNEGAQGLARAASVTTHGPRAGKAHETFDLGGGLRAHVYYDAKGKRRQYVFHSSQAAQ